MVYTINQYLTPLNLQFHGTDITTLYSCNSNATAILHQSMQLLCISVLLMYTENVTKFSL